MRKMGILLVLVMLVLAACGGGGDTDDTGDAGEGEQTDIPSEGDEIPLDTGEVTPTDNPYIVIVTPRSPEDEFALEVPLPGTLVASATEDPDAALIFDRIVLTRTGGPTGETLEIELLSDGTIIRNGVTGATTYERIIVIDDIIDELNFFGMQGALIGPGGDSEVYRYTIRVYRGDSNRMITAEDGYIPNEFQRLLSTIITTANVVGN